MEPAAPSPTPATLRLVEIAAIGQRVALDALGAAGGPDIAYAEDESAEPFVLQAPVFLSDAVFAERFPAGPVMRHSRIACSIRNAFMFSPFGWIVLGDGSVVRESLLNLDSGAIGFTYDQFKGQFPGRHIMWSAARGPVLSFNGYSTNNYFHFLIDALAQTHWRPRLQAVSAAPMIISGYDTDAARPLPFIGEALARTGWGAADLAPYDGTLMFCAQVVFPARDTGATPAKVARVRQVLRARPAPRASARLYITRPGAQRRRILNEPALAARLARRGFTAVDPGALPLDRQIAMFSEAQIVIGPHGAALTNAVFMPPGGALIELTHEKRVVWTFHEVACAAGLVFACVVGARADATQNALFADFTVDVDAVDAAVDAACAAVGP